MENAILDFINYIKNTKMPQVIRSFLMSGI